MLTLHQLWSPCQKRPEHHMSIKWQMTRLNTKTSSSLNILIKLNIQQVFEAQASFKSPLQSSLVYNLPCGGYDSSGEERKAAAQQLRNTCLLRLPQLLVWCEWCKCWLFILSNMHTVNTKYVLYSWVQMDTYKSHKRHSRSSFGTLQPSWGFFLFGSVIKSNNFLLLLMLLLETLQ